MTSNKPTANHAPPRASAREDERAEDESLNFESLFRAFDDDVLLEDDPHLNPELEEAFERYLDDADAFDVKTHRHHPPTDTDPSPIEALECTNLGAHEVPEAYAETHAFSDTPITGSRPGFQAGAAAMALAPRGEASIRRRRRRRRSDNSVLNGVGCHLNVKKRDE